MKKIRSINVHLTGKGYYFYVIPMIRVEDNETLFSIQAGFLTFLFELNFIKL